MRSPFPPVLLVSRNGEFDRSVARARALRSERDLGVVELDPNAIDVDGLEEVLGEYGLETAVRVVVLIGDLDAGASGAEGIVDEAAELIGKLRTHFPSTSFRLWFVLRSGKEIGPAELSLAREAEARVRAIPFAATVVFTASVGAAQFVTSEVVDRQVGDLLHLVAASELEVELTRTGTRTWAIGIGSVVYRPDGLVREAVRAIDVHFERLVEVRPRDPARAQGTRWVDDLEMGPPGPGEGEDDPEERLLLAGPGRGSLLDGPSRELRRLDASIDAVDPGSWAGLIAAEVDVATAPRTDPDSEERSALVVALDQVDANLELRRSELAADLEAQVRRVLEEQRSIPSADAWCEGARAAIQATVDELVRREPEEPGDLAGAYRRLAEAARKLPYSSSLLVRGLLLVVLVVVLGYVYAPIGTFVAWAFSKRVFWFGDSLEENARAWARVTAVITGTALWVWWEALWRRVRRLRRRYVNAASEQMRRMVEDHARRGRVEMLRELLEVIGAPSGPIGSLRWWLRSSAEAVDEIRRDSLAPLTGRETVDDGRWSALIPSEGDPGRVIGEMADDVLRRLAERPLEVVRSSGLDTSPDEARAAIERSIIEIVPGAGWDLAGHWSEPGAIGEASRDALTAALWPGLPEHLASRRGATRGRWFVGSSNVEAIVRPLLDDTPSIDCLDVNFAANLWATPVITSIDGDAEDAP